MHLQPTEPTEAQYLSSSGTDKNRNHRSNPIQRNPRARQGKFQIVKTKI